MSKDIQRLRGFARSMRRAPTEAEERLWGALRNRRLDRLKFRRQVPLGSYVADFVCLEAKLIVEVDGVQHAESQRDLARDANLERFGFRVLRFWNDDVMHDLEATCATIMAYARDMSLRQDWRQTPLIRLRAFTERPDPPSPARGEGRRVGTGSVVYTAILRAGPGTVWIAGNVVHQYS